MNTETEHKIATLNITKKRTYIILGITILVLLIVGVIITFLVIYNDDDTLKVTEDEIRDILNALYEDSSMLYKQYWYHMKLGSHQEEFVKAVQSEYNDFGTDLPLNDNRDLWSMFYAISVRDNGSVQQITNIDLVTDLWLSSFSNELETIYNIPSSNFSSFIQDFYLTILQDAAVNAYEYPR